MLDKENCKMHKQLQHKLKKQIDASYLDYGELWYINENQTSGIALCPKTLTNQINIDNATLTITIIMSIAIDNHFENIAINVDFQDKRSYFEFKTLIRKYFTPTNIKVTLFLNKIIELTNIDDINETLKKLP